MIGRTLAGLAPDARDRLTVATKFLPIAPAEPILARQARGSLRRLSGRALDLYHAHWPNPFVSAQRVMQSLRPLVEAGVVRRVGVSNYSLAGWQAAEAALGRPIVANQVHFSLIAPGPGRGLVPWAAGHDRLVVAYSPIAQGLLARDQDLGPSRRARAMGLGRGDHVRRRLDAVRTAVHEVAAAHVATPAQVALAWVLHHPGTSSSPGPGRSPSWRRTRPPPTWSSPGPNSTG